MQIYGFRQLIENKDIRKHVCIYTRTHLKPKFYLFAIVRQTDRMFQVSLFQSAWNIYYIETDTTPIYNNNNNNNDKIHAHSRNKNIITIDRLF